MPHFCSFEDFDRLTNEIVGPALAPFGFKQASVKKDRGFYIKNYASGDQTIQVYIEWTGYLDTSYRSDRCIGATPNLLLKMLGRPRPHRFDSDPTIAEALRHECAMFTENLSDVLKGEVDYRISREDLANLKSQMDELSRRLQNDLAVRLTPAGYVVVPMKRYPFGVVRPTETGHTHFYLDIAVRYLGLDITPHVAVRFDEVETFINRCFSHDDSAHKSETISIWMYELEGRGMQNYWIHDETELEIGRAEILNEYARLGEPWAASMSDPATLYTFLLNHRGPGESAKQTRADRKDLRLIYLACLISNLEEAKARLATITRLLDDAPAEDKSKAYWQNWTRGFDAFKKALAERFPIVVH